MPTLSASFTFSGVGTPLAKKSVAATTAFTATIDDLSGVDGVTWAIIGTDGVIAPGAYTLTTSGPKGSTVHITSKTAGTGGILRSTVQSGGVTAEARGKFYVPTTALSLEVSCYDELFEGDAASAYVTAQTLALLAFDGISSGSIPANITNNVSLTGPGNVAMSPAAGFNFETRTTTGVNTTAAGAAGSIVISASATDPVTNAGDIRVKAEEDILISAVGATSGVSIRAGATASTPGTDEAIVRGDATLTLIGPVCTLTSTTSATITSPAISNVCTTFGITGSGAFTQTCTTWGVTASGTAALSCTSLALTSTAGCTLNGIPIRTDFKVRVASTANIANLTTVTVVDSVTLADQDLVLLKDQSTPTQNGIYRFTLSTTTLARATAFDALAEYHLGTTVRAYAGTVGKGLAWFLEALSSSLPATWTAISAGGGGGTSIANGGSTLGLDGSGLLDGTIVNGMTLAITGSAIVQASNDASLAGDNGNVGVTCQAAGVIIGADSGDYVTMTWAGGSAECKVDVSGTSVRRRVYGTAGTLGLTETVNAAATTIAAVGDITVSGAAATLQGSGAITIAAGSYVALSGTQEITQYSSGVRDRRDAAGRQRVYELLGLGITSTSTSPQVVGSLNLLATRGARMSVLVRATQGAAERASWTFDTDAYLDGGGNAQWTSGIAPTGVQIASAGMTTWTCVLSLSGASVVATVTPSSGTSTEVLDRWVYAA